MSDINALSFEQAYAELEKIIEQLESGELGLDESVRLFEEGRRLSAYCQKLLDEAELRVNQVDDKGSISPLS